MKRDLPSVIKKLAEFLEVSITDKGIKDLCDHTHFDSMKANPMVNMSAVVEVKYYVF